MIATFTRYLKKNHKINLKLFYENFYHKLFFYFLNFSKLFQNIHLSPHIFLYCYVHGIYQHQLFYEFNLLGLNLITILNGIFNVKIYKKFLVTQFNLLPNLITYHTFIPIISRGKRWCGGVCLALANPTSLKQSHIFINGKVILYNLCGHNLFQ